MAAPIGPSIKTALYATFAWHILQLRQVQLLSAVQKLEGEHPPAPLLTNTDLVPHVLVDFPRQHNVQVLYRVWSICMTV